MSAKRPIDRFERAMNAQIKAYGNEKQFPIYANGVPLTRHDNEVRIMGLQEALEIYKHIRGGVILDVVFFTAEGCTCRPVISGKHILASGLQQCPVHSYLYEAEE